MTAKKKGVDYGALVSQNRQTMQRQVTGAPEPEAVPNQDAQPGNDVEHVNDVHMDDDEPTVDRAADEPAKPAGPAADKVGLNLRITKDRRAFLKSWCALHDVAMNDLISDLIDRMRDGSFDPLSM